MKLQVLFAALLLAVAAAERQRQGALASTSVAAARQRRHRRVSAGFAADSVHRASPGKRCRGGNVKHEMSAPVLVLNLIADLCPHGMLMLAYGEANSAASVKRAHVCSEPSGDRRHGCRRRHGSLSQHDVGCGLWSTGRVHHVVPRCALCCQRARFPSARITGLVVGGDLRRRPSRSTGRAAQETGEYTVMGVWEKLVGPRTAPLAEVRSASCTDEEPGRSRAQLLSRRW
eukprot:scaffold31_cov263-Pinguiococcus_pyrenoidosus.AAC.4